MALLIHGGCGTEGTRDVKVGMDSRWTSMSPGCCNASPSMNVTLLGDLPIPWVPQCQVWGEHGTTRMEDIRVGTGNLHTSWVPPCQVQGECGTSRMSDIRMEM